MKKIGMIMMATALVAGAAQAADVSVGVDFASDYVFRGATVTDGLVMQPYAEISGFPIPEEYGSLAIGTWANYDIDEGPTGKNGDFSEIDYYLSYSLPVTVVDISVGYCEYTYPNWSGAGGSDREISFSVGKAIGESGLYPYFNASYGVDGPYLEETWYLQGGLGYEVEITDALSLSADTALGYVFAGDNYNGGQDGFNDLTSSIGASYTITSNLSVSASLTYVLETSDKVMTVDQDLYGMIGVGYDF